MTFPTSPLWDWVYEAQELIEAEGEPPICPACSGGYGVYLGNLGRLDWFRCRACGIDFNQEARDV